MEEKPIECSQCKKKTDTTYTEIVGNSKTTWHMCHSCPILKSKLQGKQGKSEEIKEGLSCTNCHTTLQSVLMGELLGCATCFEIFQEVLIDQLTETNQISPKHASLLGTKTSNLHVGKSPNIDKKSLKNTQIRDLNESLSAALKEENYEEAAWLRDQINTLNNYSNEQTESN